MSSASSVRSTSNLPPTELHNGYFSHLSDIFQANNHPIILVEEYAFNWMGVWAHGMGNLDLLIADDALESISKALAANENFQQVPQEPSVRFEDPYCIVNVLRFRDIGAHPRLEYTHVNLWTEMTYMLSIADAELVHVGDIKPAFPLLMDERLATVPETMALTLKEVGKKPRGLYTWTPFTPYRAFPFDVAVYTPSLPRMLDALVRQQESAIMPLPLEFPPFCPIVVEVEKDEENRGAVDGDSDGGEGGEDGEADKEEKTKEVETYIADVEKELHGPLGEIEKQVENIKITEKKDNNATDQQPPMEVVLIETKNDSDMKDFESSRDDESESIASPFKVPNNTRRSNSAIANDQDTIPIERPTQIHRPLRDLELESDSSSQSEVPPQPIKALLNPPPPIPPPVAYGYMSGYDLPRINERARYHLSEFVRFLYLERPSQKEALLPLMSEETRGVMEARIDGFKRKMRWVFDEEENGRLVPSNEA